MNDVTPMSPAKLGPGGHWRHRVGNQSFVARHMAEPGSEDNWLRSCASLAPRSSHPRRRFRPFLHTGGCDKWPAAQPEDHARTRSVRTRSQAGRRAGGTKIGDIGRALKGIGCRSQTRAISDTQAIAGALSTGHMAPESGLAALSSQAVGMRLIQPNGSVDEIDADRDAETMAAAQVSIGMLGAIRRSRCRRSPLTISRKPLAGGFRGLHG